MVKAKTWRRGPCQECSLDVSMSGGRKKRNGNENHRGAEARRKTGALVKAKTWRRGPCQECSLDASMSGGRKKRNGNENHRGDEEGSDEKEERHLTTDERG